MARRSLTDEKIECKHCGRELVNVGTTFPKLVHKTNGRMICRVFDEHGRAMFAEPK